jgi:hypothetical protein
MRPPSALLFACFNLTLTLAATACDEHAHHDYDSLEACMVDHTQVESLPELEALTVCLVDHYDLDWQTAAECEAYVEAHGGYPASRAQACATYIQEKGR